MTVDPVHAGFEPDVNAMETDGTAVGFTFIVILFETAVVGLTQVAFDIKVQVTTCPSDNVAVVNMELFVPALTPFTFH